MSSAVDETQARDRALVEEFLRRRDEPSFSQLYRRHTPVLFAMAMRLTAGSRDRAEEVVQEAWVRALERLDGFAWRSTLRTWLCGIVVNCYREQRRRHAKPTQPLEELPEGKVVADLSAPRAPAGGARVIDLERALAALADGFREVLVLHDVNGYTHREIADLLGVEEGTSKSQLARARARMRELLARPPSTGRAGINGS